MPPRKTPPPATPKKPLPVGVQAGRKVTHTITVDTTMDAAHAIAKRADMDVNQVPHTFDVERIASPAGLNARWRFTVPGQMLVVSEADLPILDAFIEALRAERLAKQL